MMILKAENISKTFLRKKNDSNFFYAVHPIDFEIEEGAFIEIYGKSGSGKSTFLNMLSGLLKPTEGKVFFDGTDLYSLDDKSLSFLRNQKTGVVPQCHAELSSLTVLENILLPSQLYGDKEDKTNEALNLLEKFSISDLAQAKPSELSGGELRRMSIARALIQNPKIIFADEPTGDLDGENTEAVLKYLKQLTGKGLTVVMVTHEKDAEKYADKIYKLDAGYLS